MSCASATFCVAVGSSVVGTTGTPLAEKWNGTTWTLTTPPDDTLQSSALSGVSCTTAKFCLAVGSGHTGTSPGTFADKWNGATWTLVPYQEPAGTADTLAGVTCTSTTFCMAVGSSSDNVNPGRTLSAKWNGASWNTVPSPDTSTAQANQLNAVSCTSSTFCTAVGQYDDGSNYAQTLTQKWNGTSWSISKSPDTSATQANELQGVSCTSASLCVSDGYYLGSLDDYQVLAQKWNGTRWSATPIQSAGLPSDNYLGSVSCTATAFCMAVGSYGNGANDQALEEKWNGTSWATVTVGSTSQGMELSGVSCVSSLFCMAVGSVSNGTVGQNLAEKWNGSKWAKVAVPDTSPTADNELTWVSCTSATFCMAVGTFFDGSNWQTLAQKWNGTSWTLLTTPDTSSTQDNRMNGVSCTSAKFCLAVGLTGTTAQRATQAQKWNGSKWTMLTSPDPGTAVNGLTGVSCPSTTFCMAVGFTSNTASPGRTLTVRWNGSGLTTVASANSHTDQLNTVSCTSSTFCMSAGSYFGTGPTRTLTQKWNGTRWTLVTSPDKGTGNNELNGVSCVSSAFCMGAGDYFAASLDQTLTEKW